MDCNNYSYMNCDSENQVIAASDKGEYYGDQIVTLEKCVSFFGDRFYYVSDIMGDFAEEYPYTAEGYNQAVAAYNSMVPEQDRMEVE